MRGARQVGKTFSVIQFGQDHFDGRIHLIDFEKRPDWHRLFDINLDAGRIQSEMEVLLGATITPGKDLVFFDEIQACPRAIMSLRYFYEQIPELHIIAAGSLLEFAMKDISFPVGRIQLINMYPLTFAEYLIATGNQKASEIILGMPGEQSEVIHDMLLNELRNYFFIGGMPECIKTYVDTNRMQRVFEIQSSLVNSFRMDFPKYAPYSDKQCLNAVLASCARSVGQQIKYARLAEGFSNPTIKKAFNLLCQAQLLNKISAASPAGLPLNATASQRVFKALLIDIGMMQFISGLPVNIEYSNTDLLSTYKGALAEQFVGQELTAAMDDELYYWSREARSSSAEVDYLIVNDNQVYPVEVKSGPAGRLKSLHLLMKNYPNCSTGYVLSTANYKELPEHNLVFVPLYFAYSLVS